MNSAPKDGYVQYYQQIVVYHVATGRDFISRYHLFGVQRHVILKFPQSLCFPQEVEIIFHTHINPLKTKRRQLYLMTHFVPRSKHF